MDSYSSKLIIFTGAGISSESGVSTFRGSPNSLWNNHDINRICNEITWERNFIEVHEFYNNLRSSMLSKEPNKGHEFIKELTDTYGSENVLLVTQNIDTLFEKVGLNPLHVHGRIDELNCTRCGEIWYKKDDFNIKNDRCPNRKCNSIKAIKPNVVFFNGQAPNYIKMWDIFNHTMNKNTLVLIIGTSGEVISISDLIANTPCKKVLCNLEVSKNIDDSIFDKVYYNKISSSIKKIKE